MRILQVIDSIDPDVGGPPVIFAKLAAAQSELGEKVWTLGHTDDPARHERQVFGEDLERIPECRRRWLAPPRGLGALRPRAALRALGELIPRADFVHFHSVWKPLMPLGARLCRRLGKPYAVLLNGMLDPWTLQQKALKKKIALALAYRRLLDGAAFLHCGNRDEVRLLEPLGLRAAREIIPNGLSLRDLESLPPAGRFRSRHPELGPRPYVLFLSRLHYKKGLDLLAEAFASFADRVADVDLVVAGPDGGMRDEFERLIAARGVAGRVHVVGALYGEDKWAALVDAACFCLPSRQEGFSVAITEALGVGVPCVVTADCHYPEVGETGAGEVTPLDAEEVAAALGRVMADDEARRAMGRRGRQLVLERFTWPRIAAHTLELYRRYTPSQG